MEEELQPRIAADSLRARDEWRNSFPGVQVLWEETADEGVGVGFDGLDPSAMVRAYFRTPRPWREVLEWYQVLLADRGWLGEPVRSDAWWEWREWRAPSRPGEHFLLADHSHVPESLRPWAQPQETLLFEVVFRARTSPDESATHA